MAGQTLSEKIKSLLGRMVRKNAKDQRRGPRLTPRYSGTDHSSTGSRKKSLREKWQGRKGETKHKQNLGVLHREVNNQGKPFRVLLLAGLLLLGCGLLLPGAVQFLLGDLQYFRIHDIEFSGCVVTNDRGLRKFSNMSYEMNMLTIDAAAVKSRLQQHPWVEYANIRRIWPDRLEISIREHRPQALVAIDGEKGFRYLNRKGEIFAAVAPGQDIDFPVITGLDSITSELEREKMISEILSFLKLARMNNPNLPAQNVSEIHCTPEGELVIFLVKHPFPIYFGKGNIKRKYYQLRDVLGVLYRKKKGKVLIESVAYIRMDYQENKVLVAKSLAG